MRQKRLSPRPRRRRRAEPAPFEVDLDASARQVALIETGTGAQHGIMAVGIAVAAAILLTGARALWRAVTRPPSGRD